MRCLLFLAVLAVPGLRAQTPEAQGIEHFEKKVRPILVDRCYSCHSAEADRKGKLKGGLTLDTKDGLLKGGARGPALVPGKPQDSLLLQALRHDGDVKMPPRTKLSEAVIADFEKWIALGAPDPRTEVSA